MLSSSNNYNFTLGCVTAESDPWATTTMAAGFTLKEAATLEDVQAQGESLLLPTDSLFADSPILLLKQDREEKRVRCGNPITMPGIPDGTYRIYGQDQTFLCLSRAENGTLTSIKNFFGA